MSCDDRKLLGVLNGELKFLEGGGYRQSPNAFWRPQFIFEDSPSCLNHTRKGTLRPCSECLLMQFVPEDCRAEPIPCRHITLNAEGFTIDTYYRLGTHEELERAVARWLHKTIAELEREHDQGSPLPLATAVQSSASASGNGCAEASPHGGLSPRFPER
jgi:hypothetical protein